ncbi:MAG: hypothetical protein RLZZ416_41 [Candidatus Parcubacteria bacterium]
MPFESVRVMAEESDGFGAVGADDVPAFAKQSFIAAPVFGPTVPVCSMPCSFCHCFSAACVLTPKYPVGVGKFAYAAYRIFCTAVTLAPLEPSERDEHGDCARANDGKRASIGSSMSALRMCNSIAQERVRAPARWDTSLPELFTAGDDLFLNVSRHHSVVAKFEIRDLLAGGTQRFAVSSSKPYSCSSEHLFQLPIYFVVVATIDERYFQDVFLDKVNNPKVART